MGAGQGVAAAQTYGRGRRPGGTPGQCRPPHAAPPGNERDPQRFLSSASNLNQNLKQTLTRTLNSPPPPVKLLCCKSRRCRRGACQSAGSAPPSRLSPSSSSSRPGWRARPAPHSGDRRGAVAGKVAGGWWQRSGARRAAGSPGKQPRQAAQASSPGSSPTRPPRRRQRDKPTCRQAARQSVVLQAKHFQAGQ